MKSSAPITKENLLKHEEKSEDKLAAQTGDNSPDLQDSHKEFLKENEVEENMNGRAYDLTNKLENGVHEKMDSLSSESSRSCEDNDQKQELRTEGIHSDSDASKDGSVVNGAPDNYHSSSGNEDSCDGFNNNNIPCEKLFTPTQDAENRSVDEGSDLYDRSDDHNVSQNQSFEKSGNRRKASSRKSLPMRKVVHTEQGGESDYYDSDLEEYFTPIKTKPDQNQKQEESQQQKKRRTSKRKRKIPLNIDEDSDYFCIENFLNSNADEVQPTVPTKEKKKKKKSEDQDDPLTETGQDDPVPETPNSPVTKTQSVKLNLPNGMTRVVSVEVPSPGSDASMLCSLLTGKRYTSPVKGVKLKLLPKESLLNHQTSNDGEQVKKVRFSEHDSLNMVPKTVDDHCIPNKEERREGNVPLILENLLTSPHIEQSCSPSNKVPAVVENEVLDLSSPELDRPEVSIVQKSAQERVPKVAMQKIMKGNMSTYRNLNKVTLDGSTSKITDSSEKGFSKTLLGYLTSGKNSSESGSQQAAEEHFQEFGGIKVVPRESLENSQATTATTNSAMGKRGLGMKRVKQPLPPSSARTMYYAKSEYIDINELYCLQKGRRPSFEIADSDDDDVIIMSEATPKKSSSKADSSKQNSRIHSIPLATKRTNQRKLLPDSGNTKSAHPVLPGVHAPISEESTAAVANLSNKSSTKHSKSSPAKCTEKKARIKVTNNKQIPHTKDAVDHSMKDGLIESISFTVSKLDSNLSMPKPLQMKSLLNKPKKGNKRLHTASLDESQTRSPVNEKKTKVTKPNKAAVSLIKTKSPPSGTPGKGASKRVYSSLLTGNSYLMKDHVHAVRLPGKKSKA